MTPTHLFLDLEDTLVESLFHYPHYIPIPKSFLAAKTLMLEHHVVTVNIFSFALGGQGDVKQFNIWGRQMVEERLGVPINLVPDCIEISETVAKQLRLHPERCDFSDVCDFLGKEGAFKLFIKRLIQTDRFKFRKGDQFILLDDVVDDSTTHLKDTTVIRTILFDRSK